MHNEKTVLDFEVEYDAFASGHGQTTEVMKNTEEEDKFVESWAETCLRPDLEGDKPFNFELDGSAWTKRAEGVFKDDVVDAYLEGVLKARAARKELSAAQMEVRRAALAKFFSRDGKTADVPASAFFEARFDAPTKEEAAEVAKKFREEDEKVVAELAKEGAEFTCFASNKENWTVSQNAKFSTLKAKMDERMALRAAERK